MVDVASAVFTRDGRREMKETDGFAISIILKHRAIEELLCGELLPLTCALIRAGFRGLLLRRECHNDGFSERFKMSDGYCTEKILKSKSFRDDFSFR